MVAELVAQVPVPTSPDGGVAALREIMRSYFRLAAAHPELLHATTAVDDVGAAHEVRLLEVVYRILLAQGLDRRRVVGVGATLLRFTRGAAALYSYRRAWDDETTYWPRAVESLVALPASEYPALRAVGEGFPEFTQEQVFEYGLDVILSGVHEP